MKTVIRVYHKRKPGIRGYNQDLDILLECFRYMGILSMKSDPGDKIRVFDVFPPQGVVKAAHQHWADSNVARMKTFGIMAETKKDTDEVVITLN